MTMKRDTRKAVAAYLFLLPAILGLVFLTVLPVFGVAGISLTRWTGLEPPTFVGLENFKTIFTTDMFFPASVKATFFFVVGSVALGTIYSFAIAMLLNQRVPARGFLRSVFFLPYIVPSIGSAVVWGWMYESNFGVINYFLNLVGLDKVRWLGDDLTATPALVIMTVWGLGNFIVIYLAGLQGVPRAYLEAVEIDGGNAWHRFRHVTLPLMSPVIFFNVLMSVVANLQVFVPAYSITRGGPNSSTLYIVYLMFRESFQRNNFGLAAAYSLVFFVFAGTLTALLFRLSKSWTFFEGE